jgi:two-component system, OmpR family, sensor histidine kinase SenX3
MQDGAPPRRRKLSTGEPDFRPDLMSLLAHQLVTPVSTIITLAQSLNRRADEMAKSGVRDRAEKIRQAGLRLIVLIESIMERARADAGAIKLQSRIFDPRAIAQRVCQEQRNSHPNRVFEFDVDSLPTAMEGDPVLLEQVVAILLSNAIKYSPPDRPISVRADHRDDSITITIRDRGMGIPAADLPHLAKPFFRASNARSTPGTGLGLNLAQHILNLHGGRLQIESKEGAGTAVTVVLPTGFGPNLGEGI